MHTGVEGGDSGNLNTVPAFYASVSGCSTFPSRRKGTFFWLVQLGLHSHLDTHGSLASEEAFSYWWASQ
jgi:hypothetical protein